MQKEYAALSTVPPATAGLANTRRRQEPVTRSAATSSAPILLRPISSGNRLSASTTGALASTAPKLMTSTRSRMKPRTVP